jgi:hypothetical protein
VKGERDPIFSEIQYRVYGQSHAPLQAGVKKFTLFVIHRIYSQCHIHLQAEVSKVIHFVTTGPNLSKTAVPCRIPASAKTAVVLRAVIKQMHCIKHCSTNVCES